MLYFTNIYRIIPGIVVLLVLGFASILFAQTFPTKNPAYDLQIQITPQNPGPNETVQAVAQSFSFNKSTASYSWFVNDSQVASGKGTHEISITTGGVGEKTILEVRVLPEGSLVELRQKYIIQPGTVDILWSADTYTPPGYRGKALPVPRSTVQFLALPSLAKNGTLLNSSELLYTWFINNKLIRESSGRGKEVFPVSIPGAVGAETRVRVEVKDEENTVQAAKTITIAPRERVIQFYEIDALRGPRFGTAITGSFTAPAGEEKQILGVPYFTVSPPDGLIFSWQVENTPLLPNQEDRNDILIYRSDPGSRANQTITLFVQNIVLSFERLQKSFSIHVE